MYFHRTFALALASLPPTTWASVTIFPGATPRNYSGPAPSLRRDDFFRASIPDELNKNDTAILMTSHDSVHFSPDFDPSHVASGDSFVRGALDAWGQHLHLVIRPDEVWFSVLVQMNYYMATHAEDVRHLFVDHEGKEVILVEDFTWYRVIRRFADEIQARVKTDWLLDWIMPGFSTSREADYMTANVLMMGLMQQYFEYVGGIICGLPSVTLLGEKEDWERLLAKLERLADFGAEPKAYGARLRPIFERFVASFDEPDSEDTKDFWNTIARGISPGFCGEPYKVTGWIAAFFYWDTMGRPYARSKGPTKLDGIAYPVIALDESWPVGWAKVPFKMLDFMDQKEYQAYLIGGNIGKQVTSGAPDAYMDAMGSSQDYSAQSTMQPGSGWVLYGPVAQAQKVLSVRDEMGMIQASLGTCSRVESGYE